MDYRNTNLVTGRVPPANHYSVNTHSVNNHGMQVASVEVVLAARCRRTYSNAHTYHINSVSLASDGETFISVDDLRINLWHLDCNNQSFNIVDMKPPNMDDLTEVPPHTISSCLDAGDINQRDVASA